MQNEEPSRLTVYKNETVNLEEIVKSFSLLTNCSVVVFDYLCNDIVFASLSNAAFISRGCEQPRISVLNFLGKGGLNYIRRICELKNLFMKNIDVEDRKKSLFQEYCKTVMKLFLVPMLESFF